MVAKNNPINSLSASKIKTLQSCSWVYYSKYILGIPDSGNDGSSRGTVCHLIFEVLGNPRHKKKYNNIIKKKDVFAEESVKRLILKHAKILKVDDDENIELIKDMTLNGLMYDFFGSKLGKPTIAVSEQDFDIVINDKSFRYRIKGFIDKLFLYKNKKLAIIRDFKTSKQKFVGKDISDNLQDYMYSLAVKHLFPEYSNRKSEFLFLKFSLDQSDKSGVIEMEPIDEEDLEGFEIQLTELQTYIDNFSEKEATSNLAYHKGYPKDNSFGGIIQCGRAKFKGELKKDGSLMWHCPLKFPFDYYVAVNENGDAIKSFLNKDEIPENQKYETRRYSGCPVFNKIS
jgi:hypothetical protein